MNKIKTLLSLIICIGIICIGLLCGCAGNSGTAEKSADVPTVYTSFWAMYDLTGMIAGDKAEIVNLVPSGGEMHDYEPTVEDIKGLTDADLFIYNGAGAEHWADSVIASLSGSDVKTVEASEGITLAEDGNSHVWLDFDKAAHEMENIKNALAEISPENADYYEANYNECLNKINDLKSRAAELNGGGRYVVVTHPAFEYLFDALGFEQVSLEGVSGEGDPTPAQMSKVIDFMKENNIKYIYAEKYASSDTAEAAAAEAGAEVLTLNTLERGSDSYFDAMAENIAALGKSVE